MTITLSTCRKRQTGSYKVKAVTWAHLLLKQNLWPRDSFCVRLWCFIWSYSRLFPRHPPALKHSAQHKFEWHSKTAIRNQARFEQQYNHNHVNRENSEFYSELNQNTHLSFILQKMHKYFTLNSHIVQSFSKVCTVLMENQEMF